MAPLKTQPDLRPEPLSVLQVVRPATGGMRSHVAQLCRGMAQHGVACTVAGPSPIGDTARWSHVAIPPAMRPIPDVRAILHVARLSRSHDVMHAHGLRGAWIASFGARLSRTPLVVTAHNVPCLAGLPARWGAASALDRAVAVIAVSGAVADALKPTLRRPDRVVVIPNGVKLPPPTGASERQAARELLGIPADALVILAAGRLESEKGFDVLVEAASIVLAREPRAQVVIAGDGSLRSALEQQAARSGFGPRMRLIGRQEDMGVCYRAADIVAVPSRSEGQGLTPLEAMAHALPVIASRVGGLCEVVDDGQTGILVNADSPDELAGALVELLGDEVARRRLGSGGRARVTERFSLDAMLENTASVYRRARKGPQG